MDTVSIRRLPECLGEYVFVRIPTQRRKQFGRFNQFSKVLQKTGSINNVATTRKLLFQASFQFNE